MIGVASRRADSAGSGEVTSCVAVAQRDAAAAAAAAAASSRFVTSAALSMEESNRCPLAR